MLIEKNNKMQTFLPYNNFKESFKCLDYRRLGKSRVEARQIWNIITNNTNTIAWRHHPAVLMWENHENALALYHNLCIKEWIYRGYVNNMPLLDIKGEVTYPYWFGNKHFHASHRASLLFKDYEWYKQFGWTETPQIKYLWPVKLRSAYI